MINTPERIIPVGQTREISVDVDGPRFKMDVAVLNAGSLVCSELSRDEARALWVALGEFLGEVTR